MKTSQVCELTAESSPKKMTKNTSPKSEFEIEDTVFNESSTHYRFIISSIERTIALQYAFLFAIIAFSGTVISLESDDFGDQRFALGSIFLFYSVFSLFCYTRVVGEQAAIAAHAAIIRLRYKSTPSPEDISETLEVFFDKNRVMPLSPVFILLRKLKRNSHSDGTRIISMIPTFSSSAASATIMYQDIAANMQQEIAQQDFLSALMFVQNYAWHIVAITLSSLIAFTIMLDQFYQQKVHPNSLN